MFFCAHFLGLAQNTFEINSGKIDFKSEAPLELITASSTTFQAIVDTAKREFALLIPLKNFFGFNSPLQREHFFENYMEVESFASASKILSKGIAYFSALKSWLKKPKPHLL